MKSSETKKQRSLDSFLMMYGELTVHLRNLGPETQTSKFFELFDAVFLSVFYKDKTRIDHLFVGRQRTRIGFRSFKEIMYRVQRILLFLWRSLFRNKMRIPPNPVTFLFFEYYANNFKVCYPVIELLLKNNRSLSIISGRRNVSNLIRSLTTIEPVNLTTYYLLSLADIRSYYRFWRNVRRFNPSDGRMREIWSTCKWTFFWEGMNSVAVRNGLSVLLEFYDPTVVVLTEEHSVQARVFNLLRKHYAYKTAVLQHGLVFDTPAKKNIVSDYWFVWGEYFREVLSGGSAKYLVTGSVKHAQMCRSAAGPGDAKKVLIVSTPASGKFVGKDEYSRLFQNYCDLASNNRDYIFYYKVHPSESLAAFTLKHLPTNLHVTDVDPYVLMSQCEFVIAVTSTLAFESLIFRKKLILVNNGHLGIYPFYQDFPVVEINDVASMGQLLRSYQRRDEYGSEYFFAMKEKADFYTMETLERVAEGSL
jgi:hypothetical protein